MIDYDRQMQYWREATGRTWPGADVELGCTIEIGAFKFKTNAGKLPAKLVQNVMGRGKLAKTRVKAAVRLATFSVVYRGQTPEQGQTAAYWKAMETGCWA